jgi:site-specific DNA-cytosine methylase
MNSTTSAGRGSRANKLGVIELFASVAGLAQGFARTGLFDVLALTDRDAVAQRTFLHNRCGDVPYICRPIEDLAVEEVLGITAERRIHGLLGGPPCQGFSMNGRRPPAGYALKVVRSWWTAPDWVDEYVRTRAG